MGRSRSTRRSMVFVGLEQLETPPEGYCVHPLTAQVVMFAYKGPLGVACRQ